MVPTRFARNRALKSAGAAPVDRRQMHRRPGHLAAQGIKERQSSPRRQLSSTKRRDRAWTGCRRARHRSADNSALTDIFRRRGDLAQRSQNAVSRGHAGRVSRDADRVLDQ